jgi:hypothetical protein
MHIKVVIGKKTHFALACFWTVFAIINVFKGEYFIAMLEILIAMYNSREARRGTEVTAFELHASKGVK